MPSNREVKLPSGACLRITTATFERAHELFKAYCEEVKGLDVKMDKDVDIALDKNVFCTLVTSPKIENALRECMKSVTYNGAVVSLDTFKDPETWGDYVDVCLEVAKDNINPFTKNLSARFPAAAIVLARFLA